MDKLRKEKMDEMDTVKKAREEADAKYMGMSAV